MPSWTIHAFSWTMHKNWDAPAWSPLRPWKALNDLCRDAHVSVGTLAPTQSLPLISTGFIYQTSSPFARSPWNCELVLQDGVLPKAFAKKWPAILWKASYSDTSICGHHKEIGFFFPQCKGRGLHGPTDVMLKNLTILQQRKRQLNARWQLRLVGPFATQLKMQHCSRMAWKLLFY